MCGLLIENGAKVNARANNGLTPLHLCAQEDKVDAARALLANRCDVNSQTANGYTPLHVACHFGQINMVRLLIGGQLTKNEDAMKLFRTWCSGFCREH